MDELVIPYTQNNSEELFAQSDSETLSGYSKEAHTVVIGEVLASSTNFVSLDVEEVLRGRVRGPIDARLVSTSSGEVPTTANGYRILVFLDEDGWVIDNNAMFFVEGGYVWRNREAHTFFRPRSDRDWVDNIDPREDYTVFAIDDVRNNVENSRFRRRAR